MSQMIGDQTIAFAHVLDKLHFKIVGTPATELALFCSEEQEQRRGSMRHSLVQVTGAMNKTASAESCTMAAANTAKRVNLVSQALATAASKALITEDEPTLASYQLDSSHLATYRELIKNPPSCKDNAMQFNLPPEDQKGVKQPTSSGDSPMWAQELISELQNSLDMAVKMAQMQLESQCAGEGVSTLGQAVNANAWESSAFRVSSEPFSESTAKIPFVSPRFRFRV